MLYLVTVNYYSRQLIDRLLDSIKGNIPYQFIIVNNSPPEQLNYADAIVIEAGENLGFGRACNLALNWIYAVNSRAIVWLVNPDTIFLDRSLIGINEFFTRYPEVSILGTIIHKPNGEIWFAGGRFIADRATILEQKDWSYADTIDYAICDWVSGCSMAIHLANFSDCPQFDPSYFLYYEDFDFCQRYRQQGHIVAITNQTAVVHYPSSISSRNEYLKYRYCTYSYLLSLQRYARVYSPFLWWQWLKLIFNSLLLALVNPQKSYGKIMGIWDYCQHL